MADDGEAAGNVDSEPDYRGAACRDQCGLNVLVHLAAAFDVDAVADLAG